MEKSPHRFAWFARGGRREMYSDGVCSAMQKTRTKPNVECFRKSIDESSNIRNKTV